MAFNPELTNWFPVQKFRFWCQKVLPLVYDDSLSYYEILCKVVDYLNKYGEDLGMLAEDYKALVEFVNNYFEQDLSPIVQQYVNEWLDEHPEATTTVVDNSLSINKMIRGTLGYITPQMFGALADGVNDDTQAINDAMTFCSENGGNVFFPSGVYIINAPISIPSHTKLFGNSGKSIIRTGASFNHGSYATCMLRNDDSGWELNLNENIEIRGLTLECNSSDAGQMGVIHFGGVSDSIIDNCIIKINGYNCWGIILFSHNNRVIVRNTEIYNNSDEGNLGGCFWMRVATNDAVSVDNIVENCYFESTAKDELCCVANSSYTNCEMSAIIRGTTIVGKAVTTKPSFLLTAFLRQTTSKLDVLYDNMVIKGNCDTYSVAFTDTDASGQMNCTIANSQINVSAGGILSTQMNFTAENCYVETNDRNSAIGLTLKDCYIKNRQVFACHIYGCHIVTTTDATIDCDIIEDSIIYTPYKGIKIEDNTSYSVLFQNNVIMAGTYGIDVSASATEFSGIISNNVIKRSVATINTGCIGISVQQATAPVIVSGNYIDSNNATETAARFRYAVSMSNKVKQYQNILPMDNYEQIGAISSGTAGTKTIEHLENAPYLLFAVQAGGQNIACALVYNSTVTPIISNANFTFASASNTELTITSNTTTRYSEFRLVNMAKTM